MIARVRSPTRERRSSPFVYISDALVNWLKKKEESYNFITITSASEHRTWPLQDNFGLRAIDFGQEMACYGF